MTLDMKGPIIANTLYESGVLVGKDITFTFPQISFMTADVNAMGTMTVPIIGLMENLELSITKIGQDEGLSRMSRLEKRNFEFRWVQNVVDDSGNSSPQGCKAFIRTLPPNTLLGAGIEVGSASENELTYSATRIQVFVGGKEYILVDRLNQILRIDGNDYFSDVSSLL